MNPYKKTIPLVLHDFIFNVMKHWKDMGRDLPPPPTFYWRVRSNPTQAMFPKGSYDAEHKIISIYARPRTMPYLKILVVHMLLHHFHGTYHHLSKNRSKLEFYEDLWNLYFYFKLDIKLCLEHESLKPKSIQTYHRLVNQKDKWVLDQLDKMAFEENFPLLEG